MYLFVQLSETLLSYSGIFFLATVKYFLGTVAGLVKGYSLAELLLTAGVGGFLGAVVYTYLGTFLRNWMEEKWDLKPKKRSFKKRRKIVYYWRKYGLSGSVALIPILSPQVSIGIALSFKERPGRVLRYTTASILAWTMLLYLLKTTVVHVFA